MEGFLLLARGLVSKASPHPYMILFALLVSTFGPTYGRGTQLDRFKPKDQVCLSSAASETIGGPRYACVPACCIGETANPYPWPSSQTP